MSPRAGTTPVFELRARKRGPGDLVVEVFELPSVATPGLREPRYVGGLHGRNLALVEHRLLKQLKGAGLDVTSLKTGEARRARLDEDRALRLALGFRVLAPMRSRENMRSCADGIDAMGKEEAAYWLGMALHRKHPRRVLNALRVLLIEPKGRG